MIREDSTEKLVLEEHLKEMVLCRFWRKGIPGQGKSKCQGPEVSLVGIFEGHASL